MKTYRVESGITKTTGISAREFTGKNAKRDALNAFEYAKLYASHRAPSYVGLLRDGKPIKETNK